MNSGSTKELKETLKDWLAEGPQGTSRADRLLPYLASLIENPSFQDFLPVFNGILESGKDIWDDLLPGLADVVYTDLFPDNIENAFVILSSFSGEEPGATKEEDKDYAKGVKDFARFLKADVDGKTASLRALELINEVKDVQPEGSSLYQFLEHMLEKGTISAYFLDAGAVRGEVVDPKLNESPDPVAEACPNLNETPEQRQECALQRMFRRGAGGEDAPLMQLASMVTELQKPHPELLPSLAAWFAGNGPRVVGGLQGYVIRAQVAMNLSKINLASHLLAYAGKQGINVKEPVSGEQFSEFVAKALADADFQAFLDRIVPGINRDAFGERNARILEQSAISREVAALYQAPELAAFARSLIPGNPIALDRASRILSNKHRTDALQVSHGGVTQPLDKHLSQIWWTVVKTQLGEDVVLEYVVKLVQTLANQMASDFRNKGQPFSEWYFSSPYGNPGTTEMLVGFAIKEFDLLNKYHKHKAWLRGEFADEVFRSNEDDKKVF
ncbi:MAG: hypothetical protein KC910_34725, partial [Candidatus Eremiobacteraeota bacterium]|nr:hypothetical protein [Candidatus Eremiobacteraeota bacterium]